MTQNTKHDVWRNRFGTVAFCKGPLQLCPLPPLLSSLLLSSPPACSFSTLHHAPKAQSTTASGRPAVVAGGSSDGKINPGSAKSSAESNSEKSTGPSDFPPPPAVLKSDVPAGSTAQQLPSGQKRRGVSGKVAAEAVAEAAKDDVLSSTETRTGSVIPPAGPENGMVGAGETIVGQTAATDSVRKDAQAVSATTEGKKAPAAKAGGNGVGKGRVAGTKPAESPAVQTKAEVTAVAAAAAGDEEAIAEAAKVAAARKNFKTTNVVAAAPETTAAEKVRSCTLSLYSCSLIRCCMKRMCFPRSMICHVGGWREGLDG